MSQTAVNWFEIPAQDLERAATFYAKAIHAEIGDMDGPMGPIKSFQNGGVPVGAIVPGEVSATGTLIYLATSDIDAALARVESAGGRVLQEKLSIGPFGSIGHFLDSEGNRMALHSP